MSVYQPDPPRRGDSFEHIAIARAWSLLEALHAERRLEAEWRASSAEHRPLAWDCFYEAQEARQEAEKCLRAALDMT